MLQGSAPVVTARKRHDIDDIAGATAAACINMRVRQLSRIITGVYDDALRPLGITSSQFTLLAHVAGRDGIRQVEINRLLDIEKSTNARNFKRMLALGLITIGPPAGRRGKHLHLTQKGEAVIKSAYPLWREVQSRVIAAIGTGTRATLESLISAASKL